MYPVYFLICSLFKHPAEVLTEANKYNAMLAVYYIIIDKTVLFHHCVPSKSMYKYAIFA